MQNQTLRAAGRRGGHSLSLGAVLTAPGSVGSDPTPTAWPSSWFLKPILVTACSQGMRCSQGLSWASGDGEGKRECAPALLETPTRVSSAERGQPGRSPPPPRPGRPLSPEPWQRVQAPLSSPSDSEAPSETSLLGLSTKVKVRGPQVPPEGRGALGLQADPGTQTWETHTDGAGRAACRLPSHTPGP